MTCNPEIWTFFLKYNKKCHTTFGQDQNAFNPSKFFCTMYSETLKNFITFLLGQFAGAIVRTCNFCLVLNVLSRRFSFMRYNSLFCCHILMGWMKTQFPPPPPPKIRGGVLVLEIWTKRGHHEKITQK